LPPANPKKWAPFVGLLNLVCGGMAVWIIISVVLGLYSYQTWNAMAGLTIWGKIFTDFIIRLQAHPVIFGKKKKAATD